MIKKVLLAMVAVAAVAAAMMPVEASARWHGGWHGGWRGPAWGFYGPYPYYAYGPGYAPGCYRTVRVRTPYGPRWRRVWVCG
ncbi:MAG: sulfur globule protein precursor [Pseudolabrys sp.]|nr:sulfur globule protein precursor [Pseudolabrys sp.]